MTGQFIDSPVAGLRYETSTLEGVTDSAGRFEYREGEVVSFYLGNLLLGSTAGRETLSPFDLVPGAEPLTGAALINAWQRDESLQEVARIATILQSFDRDQNPGNGIDIPASVAALFVTGDEDYRDVILLVNEKNLLSKPAGVLAPRLAMRRLYQGLDIDSGLKAPVRVRIDYDADGAVESIYSYEYDAAGNRIYSESTHYDTSPDTESPATYLEMDEYNEYGWLLKHEGIDAMYGDTYRFEHDLNALGQILVRRIATSPEEFFDMTVVISYGDDHEMKKTDHFENRVRIDADGTRIDEQILRATTVFTSEDSVREMVTTRYGEDGSVTSMYTFRTIETDDVITFEQDYDSDGVPEEVITRTFDAAGRFVMEEWLVTNFQNVTYNHRFYWEYDVAGNQVTYIHDYSSDGVVDQRDERFFDADGALLKVEKRDGLGVLLSTTEYEYEAAENWWCLSNSCSFLSFSFPSPSVSRVSSGPIARINGELP